MADLSVFIAESVGENDFYDGRTDGFAANEVLKLQQIRTAYKIVFGRNTLDRAIRQAGADDYSVFHLSCHGDEDGIRLTNETDMGWPELAGVLAPFAKSERMLVMSSCFGGYVGLSKAMQKQKVVFGYVFGSTDRKGVGFTDSCIAWSILYNRYAERKAAREELRRTLDAINSIVPGNFVYRRWDGRRYRVYPGFSRDRGDDS